jgi:hypothetical protein
MKRPTHAHPAPPGAPAGYNNRILGRITHHGRIEHASFKRAMVPVNGCRKVPLNRPVGIMFVNAASLRAVPAVSAATSVAGGSFVLGGFGGYGTVPVITDPGAPHCRAFVCQPGPPPVVVLSEPVSLALLATGMMLVLLLRALGKMPRMAKEGLFFEKKEAKNLCSWHAASASNGPGPV